MESLAFIILSLLLFGDQLDKKHIIQNIEAQYFEHEIHAEIFKAAKILYQNGRDITLMSVNELITTDTNQKELQKRLRIFREYFETNGDIHPGASDDEIKSNILIFLAHIATTLTYSTSAETATHLFRRAYVGRAKKELLIDFQRKLKDNPTASTDETMQKFRDLDTLLVDSSWLNYVVDFAAIENEPDEIALIFRKDAGLFFRGNIYLISGYAGAMKSLLALAIGAAASNKGAKADRTLSFWSNSDSLRVLFVDTELARNTIRKRGKAFKNMTGNVFDSSRFKYISLRMVSGDIDAKMQVFDNACQQYKPDFIIVDSGRDLCIDFNDNKEADRLVAHFKQIASDYNAVVLTTSHKSLGNGNAKGHFGMRLNEAAGLELSLTKVTDGKETYVNVSFPKQRDGEYEGFAFKFDPEIGGLVEYAPTVDHSEESRQYLAARTAVTRALRPSQKVNYRDLKQRIIAATTGTNGKPISEKTSKNYISVLSGTVLTCDSDGLYSLVDSESEIPFDEDLPD